MFMRQLVFSGNPEKGKRLKVYDVRLSRRKALVYMVEIFRRRNSVEKQMNECQDSLYELMTQSNF